MPAICAVTAPSPVSYLRLVPNAWAPTLIDLVRQDRGAACASARSSRRQTGDETARQFNVEFRACDAAASPYLALGAIIFAGVDGIRRALPLPSAETTPPRCPDRSTRRSTISRPARPSRDGSARSIATPICASSGSRRKRSPACRRPSSAPTTPRFIDAFGSSGWDPGVPRAGTQGERCDIRPLGPSPGSTGRPCGRDWALKALVAESAPR